MRGYRTVFGQAVKDGGSASISMHPHRQDQRSSLPPSLSSFLPPSSSAWWGAVYAGRLLVLLLRVVMMVVMPLLLLLLLLLVQGGGRRQRGKGRRSVEMEGEGTLVGVVGADTKQEEVHDFVDLGAGRGKGKERGREEGGGKTGRMD